MVKYNVVPATVVDLKIDLKPTAPDAIVVKDYVGQIDKTIITNPVNSFYYANSESKITMIKPTASSVITGIVYGVDNNWNKTKTSENKTINPTNGIVLDGSQLSTNNGKYVIELQDNLGNQNKIYLQIAPKQEIANYFDTDNGKQFEKWAKANGHDNIRGDNASQFNTLFEKSKSWIKQANDNQLANAVADWFKTKSNVSSKQIISKEQIVEQLKQQIPKTITIVKFDTSNYDLNKVSFEIKGMQFQPNEKVKIVIKYGSEKSNSFILQIQNNNSPNNDKKGLTALGIIGIVIGSLLGVLLLGWLLKKIVITPFILEPMRKKKSETFQRQTEKDIAQMKVDEAEEETKRKEEKMKKIIKNVLLSISIISSLNLGLIACSSEKENEILNYSNFYVLGDSLSDIGAGTFGQNQYLENSNNKFKHFQLDEPYYKNSWSNNKVASQLIAEKFNINFKPGWLFKLNDKIYQNYGNNYAFGGEVADSSNHNLVIKSFDLEHQTKALLSQHKLQKKDLIWIEIGANDISSLMTKKDSIIIDNKINNVINQEIKAINKLIANGAKQIIISDVPDLTLTPKIKKILNNSQEKLKTASKICIKYQEAWKKMILEMKEIYKKNITPFFLSKELLSDMTEFKKQMANHIINILQNN